MKNKGAKFIKNYLENPQAKEHSAFREEFRRFLDTDPVGQRWLQEARSLRKRSAEEATDEADTEKHPLHEAIGK